MKRSSKSSLTTKYIIIFAIFFLMANIVLGFVLHGQVSKMVENMIRNSMENVSGTAADQIDGDVIGAFTEEDVGTEAYNEILHDLTAFLDNTEIEFIYTVRQVGPEKFVFTVDSDPVDPGQFGEEVLLTPALVSAGKGIAAVDSEPAEDRWGNFYTAYTPIFDSKGKVAGIVGVDFTSSWYDDQIRKNTIFVIVISILFTMVGIIGFILLGIRVRRRFGDLNKELSMLSDDVEELTREILTSEGYQSYTEEMGHARISEKAIEDGDEIQTLGNRIHSMHEELEQYLEYMRAQVNTDGLTGVCNTTAYKARIEEIESEITKGTAAFSVTMFDINDLKYINDRYGHAGGDKVIRAAATAIADVYEKGHTFRIGGDEFIAIDAHVHEEEADRRAERIEELINAYNSEKPDNEAALSLSQGWAAFVPGQDHAFKDVFARADEQMYAQKDSYHHRDESTRKS